MNYLGMGLAMALLSGAAWADSDAEKTAATVRQTQCQSCHGETGDSPTGTIPRLNGQTASYLYARLHSLRYPVREAPRAIHNMGDIAPDLQSGVIAALANYYSGQTPPTWHPAAGGPGEKLFKQGDGKDIPACQGCHGAKAEGKGNAPRLAGQHADYIELELQAFAMAARIADPMNHHVWTMTPDQMHAVAAYLGN